MRSFHERSSYIKLFYHFQPKEGSIDESIRKRVT